MLLDRGGPALSPPVAPVSASPRSGPGGHHRARTARPTTVTRHHENRCEVLSLVHHDVPAPGHGRVTVPVRAAGLDPIDHKLCSGAFGTDASTLPLPVGREVAGVVTVDVEAITPEPASTSFEAAAGVVGGTTVLVHGVAGGVGLSAAQIALVEDGKLEVVVAETFPLGRAGEATRSWPTGTPPRSSCSPDSGFRVAWCSPGLAMLTWARPGRPGHGAGWWQRRWPCPVRRRSASSAPRARDHVGQRENRCEAATPARAAGGPVVEAQPLPRGLRVGDHRPPRALHRALPAGVGEQGQRVAATGDHGVGAQRQR